MVFVWDFVINRNLVVFYYVEIRVVIRFIVGFVSLYFGKEVRILFLYYKRIFK